MKYLFLLTLLMQFNVAWSATTFVYCSEGNPSALNSLLGSDVTSQDVSRHLFSTLVQYKPGTADIEPSLAKSWKISRDGLRYTLQLREGVKFHETEYFKPSRNFNADDVVFSFERFFKKEHPYYLVGGGTYPIINSMGFAALLKSVKAVNPLTVEIELNRPFAPFLYWLGGTSAFGVFSKEYGDQLAAAGQKDRFDNFPIGSGPFIFKEYAKDSRIVMTAHPDYFWGRSKIDRLVFSITPDSSVRVQKLAAGECHLAFQPSPSDLSQIAKGTKLLSIPGSNVGYLSINTAKAPFNNVLVRRAIALALNRSAYINAIYLNNGKLLNAPIPETSWGYKAPRTPLAQDIKKAKELLTQAGFPNGFETRLWGMPVSRVYNPNGKKLAEMMQADLAKIGIRAKIEQYEWATYLNKMKNGEFDIAQMGWTSRTTDPDIFLYSNFSCEGAKTGANRSRWCNEKFDKLISDARETMDQEKRKKMYQTALDIFNEEQPTIPIATGNVYHLISEKVSGFQMAPDGSVDFYRASL